MVQVDTSLFCPHIPDSAGMLRDKHRKTVAEAYQKVQSWPDRPPAIHNKLQDQKCMGFGPDRENSFPTIGLHAVMPVARL